MEEPNLSYVYSMSGGNKDFEEKIISIIKLEFPQEKQTYVAHLEHGDLKSTAEAVHKLRHKISILGLVESYEVASNYEKNLLDGSTEGKDVFAAILQKMTDFLETL